MKYLMSIQELGSWLKEFILKIYPPCQQLHMFKAVLLNAINLNWLQISYFLWLPSIRIWVIVRIKLVVFNHPSVVSRRLKEWTILVLNWGIIWRMNIMHYTRDPLTNPLTQYNLLVFPSLDLEGSDPFDQVLQPKFLEQIWFWVNVQNY